MQAWSGTGRRRWKEGENKRETKGGVQPPSKTCSRSSRRGDALREEGIHSGLEGACGGCPTQLGASQAFGRGIYDKTNKIVFVKEEKHAADNGWFRTESGATVTKDGVEYSVESKQLAGFNKDQDFKITLSVAEDRVKEGDEAEGGEEVV